MHIAQQDHVVGILTHVQNGKASKLLPLHIAYSTVVQRLFLIHENMREMQIGLFVHSTFALTVSVY